MSSPVPDFTPAPPVSGEHMLALTRVSDLIDRALKGELARDCAPGPGQPQVLTALHINMVMDRASGMTNKQIAERWDRSEMNVCNILGHPDSQTILSTILAMQVGTLLTMEARFKQLAPQALNVKVQILNDISAPPAIRDRVATDILDRAGYAPKQRVETEHKHQVFLPAQVATGMRAALEESKRVATLDYSAFLKDATAEVAPSHLHLGSGQPGDVWLEPPPTPADGGVSSDEEAAA